MKRLKRVMCACPLLCVCHVRRRDKTVEEGLAAGLPCLSEGRLNREASGPLGGPTCMGHACVIHYYPVETDCMVFNYIYVI